MALQREFRVTYGAQTVPGTSGGADLEPHEIHRMRKTPDEFEFEFTFVVKADTPTELATAAPLLEEAFREPRLQLLVEFLDPDGTVAATPLDLDPAGTTVGTRSFNTVAEIEKTDLEGNTNISRIYRVRIAGGIGSNLTGEAGLRSDLEFDVNFNASLRGELTLRGTYTRQGASSATTQYLANVGAKQTTIITALTGAWALVDETRTVDDDDDVLRFTRIFKERLTNESTGTLDDADVGEQLLTIEVSKPGSEGDRKERRLQTITARYQANIPKVAGVTRDLLALYTTKIRPFIVANIRTAAGSSTLAIVTDAPQIDPEESILSALVVAQATQGSKTIELVVNTLDEIDFGIIINGTWPKESPTKDLDPTPAYTYQGEKVIIRTVTTTTTRIGAKKPAQVAGGAAGAGQIKVSKGTPRMELPKGDPGAAPSPAAGTTGQSRPRNAPKPAGEEEKKAEGAGVSGAAKFKLIRKSTSLTNGSRGLAGEQFDIHTEVVTEVMRLIKGVPGVTAGAAAEDPRKSRPRRRR